MMLLKKTYIILRSKILKIKKPDITNLGTNTTLNAKITEFKNEMPSITIFATTTALTAVENEILNISNLVKKRLTVTQKLVKLEIKLLLVMIIINILLLKNLIS